MTVSNKILLHQTIESLSEDEVLIVLKMLKGLVNDKEHEIEEVSEDDPEVPRYRKILEEMDAGEYVVL